jgi:TonB family protein
MRILLCSVMLLLGGFLYAQPSGDIVYSTVSDMPRFPGCDENATPSPKECELRLLNEFVSNNLKYPKDALDNSTEGVVVVRFVVDEHGNIQEPKAIHDIGNGCAEEALRVVKAMPPWIAGKNAGIPVKVMFNLPIHFRLTEPNIQSPGTTYRLTWGTYIHDTEIMRSEAVLLSSQTPSIRDLMGIEYKPVRLSLVYSYRGKPKTIVSKDGSMSSAMRKVIKQAKKGAIIQLVAYLDNKGLKKELNMTLNVSNK